MKLDRCGRGPETVSQHPMNGLAKAARPIQPLSAFIKSGDLQPDISAARGAVASSFGQIRVIEAKRQSLLPDLFHKIRNAIASGIATGRCERANTAAELGLSIRTMNRRLAESRYSFSSLRDDVRKQIALRYLSVQTIPLRDVAARLAVSEVAVLSRLCRRWFSAAPHAIRRTLVRASARNSSDTAALGAASVRV